MTRRTAPLWAAFLLVHALTAWLGWVYPSQPMGDVVLVYEPWSTSALAGGAIVGITQPWVYPQLALLPMLLAKALSMPLIAWLGASGAYLIAWAVLVSILDAVAFALLIGRRPSAPRRAAAWFWIAAMLLLGPIALYRLDAVTVPLAVVGGLLLLRHPAVGTALLTIGAWIKIWPGALMLAAVIAAKTRLRIVVAAAAVAAGVVVVLFLLGADQHLFAFLGQQTGRGLQVEAVAATPYLWAARSGAASVGYSFEILTFQVEGPGVPFVSDILTPIMLLTVAAISALAVVKAARGGAFARLFPPLALSLVTALIVTNKVGSPQFQTWLIAPMVLWFVYDRTRARVPAAIVLVLCGLTCLIYPLTYDALLRVEFVPVLQLTVRNLLLIVLLVIGIRSIAKVPTTRR
ncbi:hypothetical protein M2317_000394 [Microbacterium sp. ZKA21]|uniref:hypothetical protein n=1 Tax=Microbacterium sp. ZKA21 TaxID=3381694 RepID=UPI003D1A7271